MSSHDDDGDDVYAETEELECQVNTSSVRRFPGNYTASISPGNLNNDEDSSMNPLDIPSILDHVLKYVGATNTRDLLPPRLVNHKWNGLATEMLKEKGYCVTLFDGSHGNMESYCQVLERVILERTSTSSTTNNNTIGTDQAEPLHKLNLIIAVPDYDEVDDNKDNKQGDSSGDPFNQQVAKLIGPPYNCIVDEIVNNENPYPISNPKFYQLLQLTSASLQVLYLSSSGSREEDLNNDDVGSEDLNNEDNESVNTNDTTDDYDDDLKQIPSSFPQLEDVRYSILHLTASRHKSTANILIKIIKSAPTLQKLIILGNDDQLEPHITRIIAGLGLVNNVTPNNNELQLLVGLTHLELSILNKVSLASLTQLNLPKLKTLTLYQNLICMLSKSFCNFLVHNVPCLNNLQLYFLQACEMLVTTNLPSNEDSFDSSFGEVTGVTTVGLNIVVPQDDDDDDYEVAEDFYNLSLIISGAIIAKHFPCVNSIHTNLQSLASLCALQNTEDNLESVSKYFPNLPKYLQQIYLSIVFPNITKLSINLSHWHNLNEFLLEFIEFREDKSTGITTNANLMYPSLTSLVVSHEVGCQVPIDLSEWILDSGLQAVLKMNGIQSLEINNYFEWLPFLMNDNHDDDDVLALLRQNLKHLKFGNGRKASAKKIMDMDFTYFPSLQNVQIQEKMLREIKSKNGKYIEFEFILEKLNNLRDSYPNINFVLY